MSIRSAARNRRRASRSASSATGREATPIAAGSHVSRPPSHGDYDTNAQPVLHYRTMFRRIVCLAAFAALSLTATAQAALTAHGSVNQVYATGLTPGAQTSLLARTGRAV